MPSSGLDQVVQCVQDHTTYITKASGCSGMKEDEGWGWRRRGTWCSGWPCWWSVEWWGPGRGSKTWKLKTWKKAKDTHHHPVRRHSPQCPSIVLVCVFQVYWTSTRKCENSSKLLKTRVQFILTSGEYAYWLLVHLVIVYFFFNLGNFYYWQQNCIQVFHSVFVRTSISYFYLPDN